MKKDYHPDLKQPMEMPQVKFQSPVVRAFIRTRELYDRLRVKALQVPEGFRSHKFQLNWQDHSFTCYSVEPENLVQDDAPAILYLHGGGFVLPLEAVMVERAVYYADQLQCRVFLLEYTMSTDEPFPKALEEAYATLRWLLQHHDYLKISPSKMMLYGESAGGCLAASLARLHLDQSDAQPLAGMALVYPVLDDDTDYQSMETYRDGVVSATPINSMWDMYLDTDFKNHAWADYAIPADNRDFKDFPPVYVEALEKDLLRDEALLYAQRLKTAGVTVELKEVEGAYHAYDNFSDSPLVQNMLRHRVEIFKKWNI